MPQIACGLPLAPCKLQIGTKQPGCLANERHEWGLMLHCQRQGDLAPTLASSFGACVVAYNTMHLSAIGKMHEIEAQWKRASTLPIWLSNKMALDGFYFYIERSPTSTCMNTGPIKSFGARVCGIRHRTAENSYNHWIVKSLVQLILSTIVQTYLIDYKIFSHCINVFNIKQRYAASSIWLQTK